jgi:hypothetical protein
MTLLASRGMTHDSLLLAGALRSQRGHKAWAPCHTLNESLRRDTWPGQVRGKAHLPRFIQRPKTFCTQECSVPRAMVDSCRLSCTFPWRRDGAAKLIDPGPAWKPLTHAREAHCVRSGRNRCNTGGSESRRLVFICGTGGGRLRCCPDRRMMSLAGYLSRLGDSPCPNPRI